MHHNNVEQLCDQCLFERAEYKAHGTRPSPACAHLFRMALKGNHAAWDALHRVLWPECLGWFTHWARDYAWIEPEELAQDVWLKLFTHPPAQPVFGADDISPAMSFLRTCALRRFLMEKRKHAARVAADHLSLDQPAVESVNDTTLGETLAADSSRVSDFDRAEMRVSLRALLDSLLSQCQQHIIRDVFTFRKSRAQVAQDHPDCFQDATEVFEATRVVRKKLASSAELRELAGSVALDPKKRRELASLQMNFTLNEAADADMMGTEPCRVPEEAVLDYVLGQASPALVLQIEQSPACLATARTLAAEIGQWLPQLRYVECPDVDALVDLFENRLVASARLVVGRHVQQCPHCQEDIALLGQCSSIFAPVPSSGLLSLKTIKALFVHPAQRANALRGEILQFESDEFRITLDCARAPGRARLWTLSGEVRTLEGTPLQTISDAFLISREEDGETKNASAGDVMQEDGLFVLDGIPSGRYELHIRFVQDAASSEIILDRVLVVADAFQAESNG